MMQRLRYLSECHDERQANQMKRLRNENPDLDVVDLSILRILAEDARTSVAEIARSVGMSAPSVSERIRRLQENGTIAGLYDQDRSGRVRPAAIGVAEDHGRCPGNWPRSPRSCRRSAEIVSCDRVTGEDCFIARAQVASVGDLEAGDRPDHSLRHDQHGDHPVVAGGAALAGGGRAGELALASDPLRARALENAPPAQHVDRDRLVAAARWKIS